MIDKLVPASIALATAVLALGYGLGGLGAGVPLVVALGILWLIGQAGRRGWASSLGLALYTCVAAGGLLLATHLAAGWMLIGLTGALTAWDLDGFLHRLRSVKRMDAAARRDLEYRHLRRLLVVDGLGLLLAAVALGIRLELKLGVVLLVGLLAALGLSRALDFLSRESH